MKLISFLFISIIININIVFAQNNAEFITQTGIPAHLLPGEQFTVSITFKNTGTTTWKVSDYKMGSQAPQDNTFWGINRVFLTDSVQPNQYAIFTQTFTAPMQEGVYDFQWGIVQDGVEWFGDISELAFIPVMNNLQDSLFTAGEHFSVNSHVVGTTLFHWFGLNEGQVTGPWIPLNGRDSWDGSVGFWKRMIKQLMRADIDVLYVIEIPQMDEKRGNLFMALYQLRAEGWHVPKVCPFFDPMITYSILGYNGDASTTEGKDEIVSHYIKFYKQYYSVNTDQYADDYIYTQDNIPVLNIWHVHLKIDNYDQMTRNDIADRLAAEFGGSHPIFFNSIKMITNAISPTFSFADEKVPQFELQEYKYDTLYNGIRTSLLKPGYWDQNVRNPGDFLPRDGGTHYRNSWNAVVNSPYPIHRVQIESFNEYDEGSGIYAARTDTIYKKTDGGMNNTNNDIWSDTGNPFEYINDTYDGASQFNDFNDFEATVLWNNFPDTMNVNETVTVTILVRNDGDKLWNGANDFKFGEQEFQDTVLFGQTRFPVNDTLNDIPIYGGIFRGRVLRFDINITAPDTVGTFLTHWGMLQEYVTWFGDTLEVPITVVNTTNIKKYTNQSDIIVYPNPVNKNKNIFISGKLKKGTKIILTDINGKIILRNNIQNNQLQYNLDLRKININNGVYFIKIENNSNCIIKKLVIN